ncbi:hypothetical protein CEUSTIGMA_g11378.t1 [Chlamydomonas eustigma]|uniref:Pherophorin domain-containing protein n=1 Tax=Chlamydomonas eustigma TaxID=1157962 RepID=A0A250XLK6_9CHLO|nr:hypothetical protein CEUSTIGMA_g11378.t1 [Chlamydomonas eustigma]|eukprot:GAX83954.1 hypothetical protein CEUSTIGMA_g11378.t1 [Chlamydomonas eustigma]
MAVSKTFVSKQKLLANIIAFGSIILGHFATSTSWTISSTEITQRFSRSLQQSTPSIIPAYLIPTMEEQICAGHSCCNSDYKASPYRLQNLNSSLQYIGQQMMTTFYMSLYSNTALCNSYAGNNSCCVSDVTKLWFDVDPDLSVQYMSYGGQTVNFLATQDEFGMQLQLPQQQSLSVSPQGSLITVTVAGNVSSLCAPPDYMLGLPAGTPPICQVIVEGSTPSKAGACCPFNLAAPINTAVSYIPPTPQCSASLNSSPFSMQLASVSYPFSTISAANSPLSTNYTFSVASSAACNSTAINQCCGMSVGSIEITLSSYAIVQTTFINGAKTLNTAQSLLSSSNGGLMVFTIGDLTLVQGDSLEITLTVALTSGSSAVPDICQLGLPSTATVGACSYTFLPATNSVGGGMCCPSSTTLPATPGINNTGTCSPSKEVPISQTIMRFSYIEGPVAVSATASSPASTRFTFMVYNNFSACSGLMYCEAACNWQLYINPSMINALSFDSDLGTGANGMQAISTGSNSSVTFTAPPYMETVSYTITVNQADVTLENLCNNGALSNQGASSPCAAVLRNSEVFSVVLFSEFDVVIPPTSPSPSPYPAISICSSGKSLSGSCVRVLNATYNSPSSSTVFDFNVMNYGSSSSAPGGCNPDDMTVMSFQVLLQPSAASQLQASNALVPSSVQFGRENGVLASVTWTWTPTDGASMHYQMEFSGSLTPDAVCMQNALPGQPDKTCVVAFTGATTCYTGFIPIYFDSYLQPIPTASSPRGPKASVIAPAVVVPIVVVAAVALAGFLYWRRRQEQASVSLLGEPLAAARLSSFEATPPPGSRQDSGAIFERAPSDVFIRLPSSTH